MKFMLMMHGTKKGWEELSKWPAADFQRHIKFMLDFSKHLAELGELVLAEGLDIPANAKVVRHKPGGPPITDGPFTEAKEFLAGFWIVECSSEARAVEIAAHASSAPGPGGIPMNIPIEIRQVMSAPDV